jgi:hypothetical protein
MLQSLLIFMTVINVLFVEFTCNLDLSLVLYFIRLLLVCSIKHFYQKYNNVKLFRFE